MYSVSNFNIILLSNHSLIRPSLKYPSKMNKADKALRKADYFFLRHTGLNGTDSAAVNIQKKAVKPTDRRTDRQTHTESEILTF